MNWIQKQKNIYIYLFITILVVASFVLLSFWQRSIHNQVKADVEAAAFSVSINNPDASTDLIATTGSVTAGSTLGYQWYVDGSPYALISYPFDDGATISDISGNNLDGTKNGATFTTTGCKVGGCISLNGTSNYVSKTDTSLLDIGTGDFTIVSWIKLDTTTDDFYIIFDKGDGGVANEGRYNVGISNLDFLYCVVQGQSAPESDSNISSFTVDDTNWHFIACSADRDGNMTFMFDGSTESVDMSVSSSYNTNSTTSAIIGARYDVADHFFNGDIDEFQLYNRALTTTQLTQIYNDTNAGIGGPTEIVADEHASGEFWELSLFEITSAGAIDSSATSVGGVAIGATLVVDSADFSFNSPNEGTNVDPNFTAPGGFTGSLGYQWLVDGSPYTNLNMPFNNGSTQKDVSGNLLNSALNTTTFTTTGCKVGGCISLNGSSDYVGTVGDTTSFSFIQNTGIFSISAWIKLDNPDIDSKGQIIFSNTPTGNEKGLYFAYTDYTAASANNELRLMILVGSGPSTIDSRSADDVITDTNWHHVVATGDATNVFFYVDGVKETGSGTMGTKATGNSSRAANIGRYPYSTPGSYFDGMIDEFMVFDHQLSDAQVTQIYNDTNAGNAGPTEIVPAEHAFNETWRLDVFEFDSSGDLLQEFTAGSATIAAAAVTTLDITQPSGTQSEDVTITFTCSNADNEARDVLVEYSEDGGSGYSNATISSPSSGSISGSQITGVTCDGTSQTVTWNSTTDVEGSQSDIRIRLTAQINAAPTDATTNFSIANPVDICDASGEASDDKLTSAETSFDNSGIIIDGCTFTIDGSHTFTSLTLINSATLNHTATTTSTINSISLTITNSVSVELGSTINVNELGFVGGTAGSGTGYTTGNSTTNGSSQRMGGAHGGQGGPGGQNSPFTAEGTYGITYGDPANPTEPGAGGGGKGTTGRSGGGLVRITAGGTITVNGIITANGGALTNNTGGAGAGGGIYLNAATIAGTGTIRANGGNDSSFYGNGGGGGGRVALVYNDYTFSGTVQAKGGEGDHTGRYGAAGTVYFEDKDTDTSGQGSLQIGNGVNASVYTYIDSGETFKDITIQQYGEVRASDFTVSGTLTIESGGILFHEPTTTSTINSLDFTAASIDVQSGGTISGNSLGFVGGATSGGAGYTTGNSTTNGSTHRMGGAHGGQGGPGGANSPFTIEGTYGTTYGDPANPTEPGAGGGGSGSIGRSGGGLIRITSSGTVNIDGAIAAQGGTTSSTTSGSGAGGGIYINASTISGTGSITANGGNDNSSQGNGGGGGGRVALVYNTNTFSGTLEAKGGEGDHTNRYGAAGTVYFEDKDVDTSGQGLIQIGNGVSAPYAHTYIASGETTKNLTIQQYGYVRASDFTVSGTLTIESGGYLRHEPTNASTINKLEFTAVNIDVQSGGYISADSLGFIGGTAGGGTGYTTGNSTTNGSAQNTGGSHGGTAGPGHLGGTTGITYGNPLNPVEPGAGGGGNTSDGRNGGGLIRITSSGTVTVDGIITAGGGTSSSTGTGAGAGGGIYINTTTLAGSGTIQANGGAGNAFYGNGAGGGGRVALIYTTKTFSGTVSAYGGAGDLSTRYAAAGTVYESASLTSFTVDNNGTNAAVQTPLCYTGGATSYSFASVVVQDYGELLIDSPCTCSPNALTVTGSITIQDNGSITDNLSCTSGPPAPSITTTSLPVAPINTAYSQTVVGTGGYKPYTFSILSGSLPTGLSLNSSTGVISGTPTVSESQTFTVRLTDNNPAGGTTDDQELTIVVNSTPTAPTTLYVGNGAAQSGSSNPTNISNPYFSAVYNDADVGDTSSQYRLQVYSDANASSLVWDSGLTAQTSCTAGNRCADIQYGGSEGSLIVGNTYYWRILFVDSNSVSSPYSESAPLSNTFVYVSSGTSQTVQETRQTPNNPLALAPTIIDENTIEIEWIDRSTNEAGFRILNEFNEVIKEVPANTTSTTIENLPSNTSINGIKVVAYNSNGQSSPSQEYVEVVMPAPDVTPIVIEETETTVTLGINKLMNNLQEGKSGIEIEIKTSEGVQTSGWIRTQSHTFEIPEEEGIEVRVRTRNQEGIETEWSDWYIIDQLELGGLLLSFNISSIGTTGVGAAALRQFDLDSKMKGVVKVSNNNEINVNNLFVNMVMPSKVKYIPGTLVINGVGQTDTADEDYGQANSNAISMIVDELNGFTGMRLEFEFTFADVYKDAFRAKRIENSLEIDTTESEQNTVNQIQSIIAQAISDDEVVALTVTASADNQDQVEITQEIAADEQSVIEEESQESSPQPEEEEQQTQEEEEVNNEPPSQEEETEIQETIEEILEVIANPEPQPQNPPAPPSTIQTPSESGQTPSGQETQQGRPGIDSPGTNTSHGNGIFNVKTIGANGNTLSVSGSAIVSGNQIQFTGTASEPFSVVTVILNNNSTVIAVADRQGNWSTNVTAEQLGLQVGEEQTYEIELIAAKGDLRTDRVNIGRVKLLLKAIDELEAEFERLAKESTLETVLENIRMDVVEYIEKNEPEIQSTLGVTVPIVIASSAPLWGYIPMLPTLLYHALTYLIGYIGRKKKKERYYGVIYDAITKDPLSLVVIRIYDSATKKLAATTVSNKFGHYEVLLKDGNYYLEARKPQFVFPSHVVQSAQDGEYDHVYQSTGFTFSTAVPSLPDVPMDPLNYNAIWNKARLMKLWYSIQRAGKFLAVPVLLAGSLASILLLSVSPLSTTNWMLAIFYVAILFLQLRLRLVTKPAWGVVSDQQTNYLLGLAPIQLINTELGKIVKSRLTDYDGRYYFTPEPGQYQIKASKEGYQDTQVNIKVKKKDERVAKDINMQHK